MKPDLDKVVKLTGPAPSVRYRQSSRGVINNYRKTSIDGSTGSPTQLSAVFRLPSILHPPFAEAYGSTRPASSCADVEACLAGWKWEDGRYETVELVGIGDGQKDAEGLVDERDLESVRPEGTQRPWRRGLCHAR